ncbi:hypothetical protein [Priestia megaterium]|uniref:hypothetical protein n=1 Tax=Priestia megaterium TaxID=1404 RepID=UPI001D634C27|nr:hypothetical protein [Priestia megaterium]CAH0305970.1 hypothetical protein SRABI82_04730 [Priestia megaterium]
MSNEERNDGYEFDLYHEAMAGEIVEIDGYDGYWRVDCVRIDIEKSANEQFTDIYYDLYNIHTDQYIVACDEDISLVADAASADDFVANMAPKKFSVSDIRVDITDILKFEDKGAINMAGNNERKLTSREQSNKAAAEKKAARKKKAEMVDRALDSRLALTDAIEVFPENTAKYERKIAKYDAFLTKVSDGK